MVLQALFAHAAQSPIPRKDAHQGRRAKVVQALRGKDLGAGLEPHSRLSREVGASLLLQELRGDHAQGTCVPSEG